MMSRRQAYGKLVACAGLLLVLAACGKQQPPAPPVDARSLVQEQIRHQQESVKVLRRQIEQGAVELAVALPLVQTIEAELAASAQALAQGGDGQTGQVYEQSEKRIKELQGMLALYAEWQQMRALPIYTAGRQQLSSIVNEDERVAAALTDFAQKGVAPMAQALANLREYGPRIAPALELLQSASVVQTRLMAMQPSPQQRAAIEQAANAVVACAQALCKDSDNRIKVLGGMYGFGQAELRIVMPKGNSAPAAYEAPGQPGLRYVFVYAKDAQEHDYPVPDQAIFELKWSRRLPHFPLRMLITPEAFARLEAEYQATGQLRQYETGVKPANSLAVRWHAPWPANTVLANHLTED